MIAFSLRSWIEVFACRWFQTLLINPGRYRLEVYHSHRWTDKHHYWRIRWMRWVEQDEGYYHTIWGKERRTG